MSTPITPSQRLSIVGGGISGLSAAYAALERGETDIHVYEATQRFGGKIESTMVDGQVVNKGAECVDSDHDKLIGMCKAMGVQLSENPSMENESFQRLNGKPMKADDFYEAYSPFFKRFARDRAELQSNPTSKHSQWLKSLNLEQYLAVQKSAMQQGDTALPLPKRSWLRAIVDTLTFRNRTSESIEALTMAGNVYTSEVGQPLNKVSAAQFITETSHTKDSLLASDCKFRVEGGTELLITRLRENLAARGVKFHTGAELQSISKQADGKLALSFGDSTLNRTSSKAILALPTYALAKVQGLEALGLSNAAALAGMQYTNNIKFTVAYKPGQELPPGAFYANGFQCWSPSPGMLTFLAKADGMGTTQLPRQLISSMMESFAQSHGSSAEKLFDTSKLSFTNPGAKACYASPAPGQVDQLEAAQKQLPALAANGVGLAGTYLPYKGGYGFMECGIASAEKSVDMLMNQVIDHGQQKQWVQSVATQRAAANDPAFAIRA